MTENKMEYLWKYEIFQFDPDLARLKLSLLKENFEYREFFPKFIESVSDPEVPFPIHDFKKFGLSGLMIYLGSTNYKKVLDFIDPFKDVKLDDDEETNILSNLFYSPGIMAIEFDDPLPFEGVATVTRHYIENRGIKPHQRACIIDLSKKKKQLMAEFSEFIDTIYRHRDYSISKKDSDFEFYKQMEPDISRFRHEAWTHLRVWKMRKKRMRFADIAKKLDLTEDNARKSFYRAYELTQNRKYDPDLLRREVWLVKKEELKKTCDTCELRDSCITLCPDVLGYYEQDVVKHLKEKLLDDDLIEKFEDKNNPPIDRLI
jgi:hypothetical protein